MVFQSRCLILYLLFVVQVGLPHGMAREPEPLVSTVVRPISSQPLMQAAVDLYQTRIAEEKLPNAILVVIQNEQLVLAEALGWRDKEAGEKMQLDTLLRMASNTKAVVATAVLILQQRGLLSIDDPIANYLPAFNNTENGMVTIKQLMTHTSGWRIKPLFLSPLEEPTPEHPNRPNLVSEVNRFASIAPGVRPGTSYSYNNAGYNTIGALVEVVSGQSLEEFLSENVYEPLKMDDSSNHPPRDRIDEMSCVYGTGESTGEWTLRFAREDRMRVPFVRASGGMVSTAEDYARFCHMFLHGGKYQGKRILSRSSVRLATSPLTQSIYSDEQQQQRTWFYGLGWKVGKDGSFSHTGSEGTFVWVDPQRDVVGMALTQSAGFDNPRDEFRRAVTVALDARK
ncbi:MAG: serine hydrolase domain-containing protein [Planctomycetota bacterium]|nr:serine hydrolase domain-containing protein [Planctomycetota bacterium]